LPATSKAPASPRVVILDLDGTLVKFCIDYLGARREALKFLRKYSFMRDLKLTLGDSIFTMDRETKKILGRNGASGVLYKKVHNRLMAIVERYEMQAARRTRLLPSVKETLEELKRMDLRLILFTADGDKAVNATLKRVGIKEFFELLVCRGPYSEVKPHRDHITSAISRAASKPEETIVVGDSVGDILSGKYVNATTVGVVTGLGTRQQLAEAEADYIIDSVAELPLLIRRLRRGKGRQ